MFNSVDEQISAEVKVYVNYCQAAAKHDEYEPMYKLAAHAVFCHIEEMRQTGRVTVPGRFVVQS